MFGAFQAMPTIPHHSRSTLMRLNTDNDECCQALCQLMVQESLVSSADEALAVFDSMMEEHKESGFSTERKTICLLCEYFNLSMEDSLILVRKHFPFFENVEAPLEGDSCLVTTSTNPEISSIDPDEIIGPGDCELCERDNIRLTRHHLIPKCTWRRTEPMILALWMDTFEGKSSGNVAFDELHHLLPEIDAMAVSVPACHTALGRQAAPGKRIIRNVLSCQTIDICRSCHDHIHKTHDNRTLSLQYNTLDKLLEDPCIAKYARWAHHQKSKTRSHEGIPRASKSRHRFKKK